MADPTRHGPRRWVGVAACLVACLVAILALPAASQAPGPEPPGLFRAIQLNLCNSGIASCYTGRSVAEAATVIRAIDPDLVTLNEICEQDGQTLRRAMARPGTEVAWAFMAAGDRPSAGPTRCLNGQPYGIGLLVRLPAADHGYKTYSGIYPVQDPGDPEERAWLCVHATDAFYGCTTHLASTSASVALAQCGHLLRTIIPGLRAQNGYAPTIVGGDLNIGHGSPDMVTCMPAGYQRVDDGAVQQIVATNDFTVSSSGTIEMRATDHPGLLVTLKAP